MSAEAAMRRERDGGAWGRVAGPSEPGEERRQNGAASAHPQTEVGGGVVVPLLVREDGDDAEGLTLTLAGAADGDPYSLLDSLLTAAAELIGQAIELRRRLEALSDGGVGQGITDASLSDLVADYERRLIEAALQRTQGNRARAARLLRTTERILGYRVQRYGIDCEVFRG